MPAIVYSKQDPAGSLVAKMLRETRKFDEIHGDLPTWIDVGTDAQLIEVEGRLLDAEDLHVESDYVIFASRHRSKSAKPAFTVHVSGNWGKAEMGGSPGELAYAQPSAMKHAFMELNKLGYSGFEVSMEATHHGPTSLLSRLFFIELGSSEAQWADKEAAKALAGVIVRTVECERERQFEKVAVGIGGGHYCPDFAKIELTTDIAFAYVMTNHDIAEAGDDVFSQAVQKSGAELVVIDWKGLKSAQRQKAIGLAEGAGLKWVKDDEVKV